MVKKFKDMYNRLRPVYSDTTQLNSTSSWVELHRYKRAFRQNTGVWRTDGQTDILPRHIVRAMHTRRAVNSNKTMTCHALVKSNEHLNGNVFSRCLETSKCRWDDVRRQTGPYASPVESGLSIESGVYQGVSSRDHAGGRPTDKSMCLRSAMCAGTLLSSRALCPNTEMRRAAGISPNGVRPARACTSTLLTKSDQRIPSIWCWHFMWKASNAFMSVARRVQVSAAYISTVYIHLYSPERQQQQLKEAPNTQQQKTKEKKKLRSNRAD